MQLTEMNFGQNDLGELHFGAEGEVMQNVFRGRAAELKILDKKYNENGFVMTVLYGRWRVGKTKLINKFMSEHDCKRNRGPDPNVVNITST